MIRKIIKIDESKCDGCGLCVSACHEGAIGLVGGVAKLLSDDYCDGLGDCLPACPAGAITFEEREAAGYDEAAVKAKALGMKAAPVETQLRQWPVQIQLVPPGAPYFRNADLLVAADCSAYAFGDFHNAYMKGRATVIGCPKLDDANYADMLSAILKANDIKSVTLTRMSVPCCGGLENAAMEAIRQSGKDIPLQVVTISTDGSLARLA